jgi:DNA topoisomerase I
MGSLFPTSLTPLEQDILVQTCAREAQWAQVRPQNFYRIEVTLKPGRAESFILPLRSIKSETHHRLTEQVAHAVLLDLKDQKFSLQNFEMAEVPHIPASPINGPELQLTALLQWGWTPDDTQNVLQQLTAPPLALAQTGVSPENIEAARMMVLGDYGKDYLPARARALTGNRQRQGPLTPTAVQQTPKKAKRRLNTEQQALYQLIWSRFVAWQMADALLQKTLVQVTAGDHQRYQFERRDTGILFRGYMQVHEQSGDAALCRNSNVWPTALQKREPLRLVQFALLDEGDAQPQHFEPADFYKKRVMGRVDVQNALLSLLSSQLLQRNNQGVEPTDLGMQFYREHLEQETTNAEPARLSPGNKEATVSTKKAAAGDARRKSCPECGKPLIARQGKFGRFLACKGYPQCRHTQPFSLDAPCPEAGCHGHLVERRTARGKIFFGCSDYPRCNHLQWDYPVDG